MINVLKFRYQYMVWYLTEYFDRQIIWGVFRLWSFNLYAIGLVKIIVSINSWYDVLTIFLSIIAGIWLLKHHLEILKLIIRLKNLTSYWATMVTNDSMHENYRILMLETNYKSIAEVKSNDLLQVQKRWFNLSTLVVGYCFIQTLAR